MSDDLRKRINEGSPEQHALSRKILGLDWYDTESQARRVIEHVVAQRTLCTDAMVSAGFEELDRRGFRVGLPIWGWKTLERSS